MAGKAGSSLLSCCRSVWDLKVITLVVLNENAHDVAGLDINIRYRFFRKRYQMSASGEGGVGHPIRIIGRECSSVLVAGFLLERTINMELSGTEEDDQILLENIVDVARLDEEIKGLCVLHLIDELV